MAGRSSPKNTVLRIVFLVLSAGMLLLGIFLMLNRTRARRQSEEDNLVLTPVQTVTTMNLDQTYPNNERDVVAMWARIEQTLYNEEYTDAEADAMCEQLMVLYDNAFLLNQPNYAAQLRHEVQQKKEDGITISTYVVGDRSSVVYFKDDEGYECAGLECQFTLMSGPTRATQIYNFILRKDETARWKIFGWSLKDDQTIHLITP
ncbi:MAG: hypothetical protein IJQ12_00940 [Lachnospiraceae bacterium]|nr:hypothetical protein [Lachnospiraceae bacterium]